MNLLNRIRTDLGFKLIYFDFRRKPSIQFTTKPDVVLPTINDWKKVLISSKNSTIIKLSLELYGKTLISIKDDIQKIIEIRQHEIYKLNADKLITLIRSVNSLQKEQEDLGNQIHELSQVKIPNTKNEIFEKGDYLKKKLLQLIENAEIKMVFQELKSTDTFKQEITHLQFRYSAIEKEKLKGEITNEEYRVEKNKIISSLILLVNEI